MCSLSSVQSSGTSQTPNNAAKQCTGIPGLALVLMFTIMSKIFGSSISAWCTLTRPHASLRHTWARMHCLSAISIPQHHHYRSLTASPPPSPCPPLSQDIQKRPAGPVQEGMDPVTTPQQYLGISGWGFTKANELFNGRVAMMGFALAVVGELSQHRGPIAQVGACPCACLLHSRSCDIVKAWCHHRLAIVGTFLTTCNS